MTNKKLTNRQALVEAQEMAVQAEKTELAEKLGLMIQAIDNKKASKAPTKKQIENDFIKDDILDFLQANSDSSFTVTEILKGVESCNDFSNQKVSSLVRQLVASGAVTRLEVKGRAKFTVKVDA